MASTKKQASAAAAAKPHVVSYDDLLRKDPAVLSAVEKAYGPGGLGVIAVSGVPGLSEARSRLLPLARAVAQLPAEQRKKLEDPSSRFNFGWSHGKEALSDGRFDVAKGSFYANPLLPEGKESPLDDDDDEEKGEGGRAKKDAAADDAAADDDDDADKEASKAKAEAKAAALARFPGVCRPNVWPPEGVLPELRPAFKEAGRVLADAAVAVAGACDAMIEAKMKEKEKKKEKKKKSKSESESESGGNGARGGVLRSLIESGDAAKGRLLYYYPRGREKTDSFDGGGVDGDDGDEKKEEGREEEKDGWCGVHVDNSALTALTRAMYLDADTGEEVECPDPEAGLWVQPRRGWRRRRRRGRRSRRGGRRTRSGDGDDEDDNDDDDDKEQQEQGEEEEEEEEAPFVRVLIPPDVVAVQAGEAAQVVSGGLIVATPHCVRAASAAAAAARSSSRNVARATFALFMQPRWDAPLEPARYGDGGESDDDEEKQENGNGDAGENNNSSSSDDEQQQQRQQQELTPESIGVARWRPGDTFGDFSERTFDAYYK